MKHGVKILAISGIFSFGIVLGFLWRHALFTHNYLSLMSSLWPEAVGIIFTVCIIDQINKHRSDNELKDQLIREISNIDNGLAARAFKELRAKKWLLDGSLTSRDLSRANLVGLNFQGADLRKCNLSNSNFVKSKFENANLFNTNLRGSNFQKTILSQAILVQSNGEYVDFRFAYLWKADLSNSYLKEATFQNANLVGTILKEANLTGANISGADLSEADLSGAILDDIIFDERTILPNGEMVEMHVGIEQLKKFSLI